MCQECLPGHKSIAINNKMQMHTTWNQPKNWPRLLISHHLFLSLRGFKNFINRQPRHLEKTLSRRIVHRSKSLLFQIPFKFVLSRSNGVAFNQQQRHKAIQRDVVTPHLNLCKEIDFRNFLRKLDSKMFSVVWIFQSTRNIAKKSTWPSKLVATYLED